MFLSPASGRGWVRGRRFSPCMLPPCVTKFCAAAYARSAFLPRRKPTRVNAMDLGPHAVFIVTTYATAAIIVGALVLWVFADYRALKRSIAEIEASGTKRRSDR